VATVNISSFVNKMMFMSLYDYLSAVVSNGEYVFQFASHSSAAWQFLSPVDTIQPVVKPVVKPV